MDLPVTILNFLLYEDKETKEKKIRIGYLISDKEYCQNSVKFKGYAECSVYLDSDKQWEDLDVSLCGKPATFKFIEVINPRNPLKKINKLTCIITKDGSIDII